MRGGRYRFTTEPNLNKVIMEREGSIGDDLIVSLLNDALKTVAPSTAPWNAVLRVSESSDIPDEQRLVLGVLDYNHTLGTGVSKTTLGHASTILTQRGPAGRTNKNAVVLVAAADAALAKARATARNLAAMHDLQADTHRLKRFNEEQRADLADRVTKSNERLPVQLAMAYRHLLQLNPAGGVSSGADHVDLGPAKVNDTITGRVHEYLSGTDHVLDNLAPAALLSDRFALIAPQQGATEIASLLAAFHRYPRLPKLASADVLRRCLVSGVKQGVFGLASGSAWDAEDAVLRFRDTIDPTEVVFQPGIWLVRAATIKQLIDQRGPQTSTTSPPQKPTVPEPPDDDTNVPPNIDVPGGDDKLTSQLVLNVVGVPAEKARDVLKVAVLPLSSQGAEVTMNIEVTASAPDGIPAHLLDLVINEGLRQLGLKFDIETE